MSQSNTSPIVDQTLLYRSAPNYVDEIYDDKGQVKEHWQQLLDSFQGMGAEALSEREAKARRILRDDGATYTVLSGNESAIRNWELDLVPMLLDSEEWARIESGLLERAELFDALFKDIYGPRDLIRRGVIPSEAITSHASFLRACQGMKMPGEQALIMHAVDLVRDESGQFRVLTDRTQAPSGMGYALENRTVMSRVLPSLFRDSQVHRLAPFFQRIRQKLSSLSNNLNNPRVVMLTPGSFSETYFEHSYIANYMGFPVVQSGDLVVRNGLVWMKSLDGLARVDVILRRVDDWYCDPVELKGDSQLGVPGLLEVVRAGNVSIANPLGSGILENPVLLKYLPEIGKALLGREPRMPSVDTYWCGDPEDMKYILAHLDELVIKPSYRGGGLRSSHAGALDPERRAELVARIKAQPWQFVAQPRLTASHLPAFKFQSLVPRPAILRTYAIASDSSYSLMPGGLTRVGTEEGVFLISGQVGSQSKDTWVVASEPESGAETASSADAAKTATSRHLVSLPSRLVENMFWMGRYAERAEASIRILRTVLVLLNSEESVSDLCRQQLLHTVTAVTGTHPGFMQNNPDMLMYPEQELLDITRNPNRVGSVLFSFNALLQSADDCKELLSSDTLRVINNIRDALENLERSLAGGLTAAPEEALNPLVTALIALAGLSQESMIRGIGWRFMELGRRIERGLLTSTIMEQLTTHVVNDSDQQVLLEALLINVEALNSYRRRYRARLDIRPTLELLLFDDSNPRSLIFQVNQLATHIGNLPKGKNVVFELSAEERNIREAEHLLKMSKLAELCEMDGDSRVNLESQLVGVRDLLKQLSNQLSDKYFDHRAGPQQLVSRNWDLQ